MTRHDGISDFISKVNDYLNSDKPTKILGFKVLYGKIKIHKNAVELESVYPLSKGMKVLFGKDRIVYPIDLKDNIEENTEPIFIAVNLLEFNEAENHDFVKTLGHPPTYEHLLSEQVYFFRGDIYNGGDDALL